MLQAGKQAPSHMPPHQQQTGPSTLGLELYMPEMEQIQPLGCSNPPHTDGQTRPAAHYVPQHVPHAWEVACMAVTAQSSGEQRYQTRLRPSAWSWVVARKCCPGISGLRNCPPVVLYGICTVRQIGLRLPTIAFLAIAFPLNKKLPARLAPIPARLNITVL